MPQPPVASQLQIPPMYGAPNTLLTWEEVDARLAAALRYWLATTRPDGRPHVVPHDGLWLEGRWHFGGSDATVKHKNLLANSQVSLHLESGDEVVIVEGACEIETPDRAGAEGLAAASKAKYGFAPPPEVYMGGVWVLTPKKAMAWTDLTVNATRFDF